MVEMSFYDDGTSAQEERNDRACIEARKAAGVLNPEKIDDFGEGEDCSTACPIYNTTCPFREGENSIKGSHMNNIPVPVPWGNLLLDPECALCPMMDYCSSVWADGGTTIKVTREDNKRTNCNGMVFDDYYTEAGIVREW